MAERFSHIEKPFLINHPRLEERLREYPELKAKIEAMLAIIENAGGDVEKAAEAERRIIEELRQMGNEVLGAVDNVVNLARCKSLRRQLPVRTASISGACGGNKARSAR